MDGDVLLGGLPGPDADSWFVNADVYPRANWPWRSREPGAAWERETTCDRSSSGWTTPTRRSRRAWWRRRWHWRWQRAGSSAETRWVAAEYVHTRVDNRGHVAGEDDDDDSFRLEIRWDIP